MQWAVRSPASKLLQLSSGEKTQVWLEVMGDGVECEMYCKEKSVGYSNQLPITNTSTHQVRVDWGPVLCL